MLDHKTKKYKIMSLLTSRLRHNSEGTTANARPADQETRPHGRLRERTRDLGRLVTRHVTSHLGRRTPETQPQPGTIPLDAFDPVENIKIGHMNHGVRAGHPQVLNRHRPVADARRVQEVTGVDMGALVGYIDLPRIPAETWDDIESKWQNPAADEAGAKLNRVYIFDPSQMVYKGKHRSEQHSDVMLVGHAQLEQIMQTTRDPHATDPPTPGVDMPLVGYTHPRRIGRAKSAWLPANAHKEVNPAYRAVSAEQAQIAVNQRGEVVISAMPTKNMISVLHGPEEGERPFTPHVEPVDPWPTAPVMYEPRW